MQLSFRRRVRWNNLHKKRVLLPFLPSLPPQHAHIRVSLKEAVGILLSFSCLFCCAGIKPQGLIHDSQVLYH